MYAIDIFKLFIHVLSWLSVKNVASFKIQKEILDQILIRNKAAGAGGHEQLISNSILLKPALAKRDNKNPMIDLCGVSTRLV